MKKSLYRIIFCALPLFAGAALTTSCVETESTLVEFVEDNRLDSPNDTVYSLVGIIGKMQQLADRTVLLGELRGDLTALTPAAPVDLQAVANFTADASNPYNSARDYYAVIQNCNYYLAHADSALTKRGEKVFQREIAVVRTYRAWTYLQLVLNYGRVPFFTEPLLTEKEAEVGLHPFYDLQQVCAYFIDDLAPYVDTPLPAYGEMQQLPSRQFFFPVRVLLGDLCLWSGRYREAATWYHEYLSNPQAPHPTEIAAALWDDLDFTVVGGNYASQFSSLSSEKITILPMAASEYDGTVSRLADVFTSTQRNNYFYQATRSAAYDQLSQSQHYTMVYRNSLTQLPDTICPPLDHVYPEANLRGDLRQNAIYQLRTAATDGTSLSNLRLTMRKYSATNYVTLCRLQHVYLRYAEALNRVGLPQCAFAVLKYGLCTDNLIRNIGGVTVDHIPAWERAQAGDLISFSTYQFTAQNTQGIHSRGCGAADADNTYEIPALGTLQDSIQYVEDRICDEMALETAGEGQRWYDLMRLAQHRDDATYLASRVANRQGTLDAAMYSLLSDRKNWFLPLE